MRGTGRRLLVAGAGLAVLVLLVVAGVVAFVVVPAAPVATGYPAKIVCSAHFVSGRTVDDALGDLPPNPLRPLISVSADESAGSVTARLAGVWSATAWYTPGLGCTAAERRPDLQALEPLPAPPAEAPWPEGSAVDPEARDAVDADAVDAAVDRAFVEDDPEGLRRNTRAVVVVSDGRLVAERYADGFDARTPLLGWSMTKSVANVLVGRLVADGTLTLDRDRLQPGWDGDKAAITLEHALSMTDGLAFEEVYDVGTDATTMLFTPTDASEFAAAQPLEDPPGTDWEYSSGTSNIVCDVAQRAAGAGPELARDLVFDPLGMTSAVLEPDLDGGLVCSSFLYATAQDWARVGQLFAQDGRWDGEQLLPAGWVERSTTPVAVDSDEPYGLHWWLNEGAQGQLRMPRVPADAYWASGNEGQQVVVIPSADLVVVRLGLSQDFSGVAWGLEPLLADLVDAVGG